MAANRRMPVPLEEETEADSPEEIRQMGSRMQHKLRKEKWVKRIDWLKEKAQALLFFNCVNDYIMAGMLICVGILAAIALFGGCYQPYIKKSRHDIDVTHPELIYIASSAMMLLFVLTIAGFWPEFGYWTIALVPVLSLGYMMSMHFLPDGFFGGVCFVVANIGIVVVQYSTQQADQCKP